MRPCGSSLEVVIEGASVVDGNSLKGTAQPWLRSLDDLNTHDNAYPLSIASVMTALILPNSIGACVAREMLMEVSTTYRYSGIRDPFPQCFLNRLIKSITLFLALVCHQDGGMSLALIKSEELTYCVLRRHACSK